MNNHVKTSVALAIALVATVTSYAQNTSVYFGYDADGNRESRTLAVAKVDEKGRSADTIKPMFGFTEESYIFGEADLSVYPNPTHDRLTIAFHDLYEICVKACILTIAGEVLVECDLSQSVHDIDISRLPSGVYMLQLSAPNMTRFWKIIKE